MNIFFNHIYVIESLRKGDTKTGEELVRQLGYLIRNEDNLKVQLCDVASKRDLINLLKDIRSDAESKGVIPYLHFETHGNEHYLETKNGDSITWEEFRPLLTVINRIVKNNLFVSVAACFGGFIFRTISILESLPFCAFVGPPEETLPEAVQIDWQAYFQTLLKTRSFGTAVDALNENNPRFTYFYYTSERLVAMTFKSFNDRYQDEKFIQGRIEDILTLARQTPGSFNDMPKEVFRAFIRKELQTQPKQMNKWEDYITFKTDEIPQTLREAQAYFEGRSIGL